MVEPSNPFPIQAFSELATMESGHWWFRARNKLLLWILQDKINPQGDYLEVGCGTGYVLEAVSKRFPGLRLEATEFFDAGLGYARARTPACQFREMDATRMNEVTRYNCIGCFDVLEHIANDEIVIENLFRALQPQGNLLITVPQHQWLWSAADDFAHHVRRYSRQEIVSKLRRVGFRLIYSSSFVSLLLPLMAIQRLGSRPLSQQENYGVKDVIGVNPIVNRILYIVMRVEVWLLKLGFTFPAGGSLVLVAQKP
jgi:SAM-dependent methyltransferase